MDQAIFPSSQGSFLAWAAYAPPGGGAFAVIGPAREACLMLDVIIRSEG